MVVIPLVSRVPGRMRSDGYAGREMAKTTEQIIEDAKKAGVEVTVTQRPKGAGEVVSMPGLRGPAEDQRAADLLADSDGGGVDE